MTRGVQIRDLRHCAFALNSNLHRCVDIGAQAGTLAGAGGRTSAGKLGTILCGSQ